MGAEPDRLHVVHEGADGRAKLGALMRAEHGKPLFPGSKIVHVDRDPERPGVLHMTEIPDSPKVQAMPEPAAPPPQRTGKGPPKVTSDAYREGWGTIFGGTVKPGVG